MNVIPLTNGGEVIIDESDYEFLSQFRWYKSLMGYACTPKARSIRPTKPKLNSILMHRILLNAERGQVIDHINGNPLDNRRENLRVCTTKQNVRNRKKSESGREKTSSIYKGVSLRKADLKWCAFIHENRKSIYLGAFSSEQEAAAAYNQAAIRYFGEFAQLNSFDNSANTAQDGFSLGGEL
jgi:hypothetical protein